MLAKIGYSSLVAIAGYGEFKPLILEAITSDNFNFSYLVGQNSEWELPDAEGDLHTVRFKTLHDSKNHAIFVAEVRLFQNNHTPTYHVVVGETNSPDQFDRVIGNIVQSGRSEIVEDNLHR